MSISQKTVMVVEDEPDAADLFAEMMRLNGYRVIKTYAGAPAIGLMREQKPDAIILDIMMPDISGLEILRRMRSEPELASIPVVVVSAKATPADIQSGLDAGATIYLTKPVSYVNLKNAVDGLLQVT